MYGHERRLQNLTTENVSSTQDCQSTARINRLIWESTSGEFLPWWLLQEFFSTNRHKLTRLTIQTTAVRARTICCVSRLPLTAEAWVQSQPSPHRNCCGQRGTVVHSQYLCSPLSVSAPRTLSSVSNPYNLCSGERR